MIKGPIGVFILLAFIFSLSGCASARKQQEFQIQGLRNQISLLEAQLQTKDDQINALKENFSQAQADAEKEAIKKNPAGEVKSRPNIRQVQIALVNAGYNPGRIDGRMGKQTKDAIKQFQKANNLAVDGKAGKQTWDLLKGYLYKKVK